MTFKEFIKLSEQGIPDGPPGMGGPPGAPAQGGLPNYDSLLDELIPIKGRNRTDKKMTAALKGIYVAPNFKSHGPEGEVAQDLTPLATKKVYTNNGKINLIKWDMMKPPKGSATDKFVKHGDHYVTMRDTSKDKNRQSIITRKDTFNAIFQPNKIGGPGGAGGAVGTLPGM